MLKQQNWCSGCGNYVIFSVLKELIKELDYNLKDVVMITGCGCHGKMVYYYDWYGVNYIHGRAIPFALGVKKNNPNLKVIVCVGDGDTYSIGLSHFLAALEQDIDINILVHNNGRYALTKGQLTPVAHNHKNPLNIMKLAYASNCQFLARTTTQNKGDLKSIIKQAFEFNSLSFIDIIQLCVNYNPQIFENVRNEPDLEDPMSLGVFRTKIE